MIEYKKECLKKDQFTEMGESMRKLVDLSLRKEKESERKEL